MRNANYVHENLGTIRSLLNVALKLAIVDLDFELVSAILIFSEVYMLTLNVEAADLDLLLLTESFVTIQELVQAQVQVERQRVLSISSLTNSISLSNLSQKNKKRKKEALENSLQSEMTRSTLSLTGVVDYSFFAGVFVSDDMRFRMIGHLQASLDFEELASVLIRHKRPDLLFALISRPGLLRKRNQNKLAIGAFKASVGVNEYALALQIWNLETNVI